LFKSGLPDGIFSKQRFQLYGHLVYVVEIWCIFPRVGTWYQEKSGNPGLNKRRKSLQMVVVAIAPDERDVNLLPHTALPFALALLLCFVAPACQSE
jgi:hypothetical protein